MAAGFQRVVPNQQHQCHLGTCSKCKFHAHRIRHYFNRPTRDSDAHQGESHCFRHIVCSESLLSLPSSLHSGKDLTNFLSWKLINQRFLQKYLPLITVANACRVQGTRSAFCVLTSFILTAICKGSISPFYR